MFIVSVDRGCEVYQIGEVGSVREVAGRDH